MIREFIALERGELAFREVARTSLAPDQIRVRSLYGAAKHGTEMALFKGYGGDRGGIDPETLVFTQERALFRYPVPLGNICVGGVIEVGSDVSEFELGERVFAFGSFREEHIWPKKIVRKLPDGVPWQAAVCLDPVEFALGAVRDGNVRIGDAVAVFGMGAIGLMALQLAKVAGAYPVIAVEPLPNRRALAEACGADLVLDPTAGDAGLEIKRATGNRGADVCIEYSGNHRGLQAALRGVVYGGVVVAGAWPAVYPAGLDLGAEAHHNRPTIVFSRACSDPNPDHPNWNEQRLFEMGWRLLTSSALRSELVVQPIVEFDDLLEAYPKIDTRPDEFIKLGVRFKV